LENHLKTSLKIKIQYKALNPFFLTNIKKIRDRLTRGGRSLPTETLGIRH